MTNFMFTAFWSATVAALIINTVTIMYVATNNTVDSNSNTVKHYIYINNSKRYFTSYSQLTFFPGDYQLDVDLVFENIKIFTTDDFT